MKLLFKGGRVVSGDGTKKLDILVKGGEDPCRGREPGI